MAAVSRGPPFLIPSLAPGPLRSPRWAQTHWGHVSAQDLVHRRACVRLGARESRQRLHRKGLSTQMEALE